MITKAEFENILRKKREELNPYLKKERIEAFRLYDKDNPGVPALVDIYKNFAHIQIYEQSNWPKDRLKMIEDLISGSLESTENISQINQSVKIRRQTKGKTQYEKIDAKSHKFPILERDCKFAINLTDYLDTGIFLDHRETRKLVAGFSKGKERLLNLFSYTGSFSVAAAKAGIKYTTSVDMSNTYCDWARENFILNQMDKYYHIAIRENVMVFLKTASQKKWKFDLIVIDPPTFSKSKKMRFPFDVQRDHPLLINSSLELFKSRWENNFFK